MDADCRYLHHLTQRRRFAYQSQRPPIDCGWQGNENIPIRNLRINAQGIYNIKCFISCPPHRLSFMYLKPTEEYRASPSGFPLSTKSPTQGRCIASAFSFVARISRRARASGKRYTPISLKSHDLFLYLIIDMSPFPQSVCGCCD